MRLPYILKLRLTERCNLKCKHCYLGHAKNDLNVDKMIKIFEQEFLGKIGYVCLTGGEALLHKELKKIIDYLYSKKINYCIASNGILLDEFLIEYFVEKKLNYIQISLEAPIREINDNIRGDGVYNVVIRNIKNAVKAGLRVVIGITINHQNYMYINEMKELAEALGADIRYEIFLPIGEGEKNEDVLKIRSNEMKIIIETLKKIESKKIRIIKPELLETGCGAGDIFATINPDFTISPCDMLCEKYKSNIIEKGKTFKEVWEKDEKLNEWRRCMNIEKNFTGCKAASYVYTGRLDANDLLGEELMR